MLDNQKQGNFLSAGVHQQLSQFEKTIGCEEGVLTSVSSPMPPTEALDHHFRLCHMFGSVSRKKYASLFSACVGLIGCGVGMTVNSGLLNLPMTNQQVTSLNVIMGFAAGIGFYCMRGLKKQRDAYQLQLDHEIACVRARIPAQHLK